MTKGKNKKIKITKMYLFLLPPLPSQDGGVVATPPPPNIFYGKNFCIDTWASGQRVGKLPNGNLSKKAKTVQGKIRKGEGVATAPPPPLLRERAKAIQPEHLANYDKQKQIATATISLRTELPYKLQSFKYNCECNLREFLVDRKLVISKQEISC